MGGRTGFDLKNALVSAILTGYAGFTTSAGHVGPRYRVDHDISMLVPELWCRIRVEERASPLAIRLEQLLATLPEPQRAALVLRYQEDLTPEEIAATLQSPLATVKRHLQRGLKLLRAKAQCHLKEYIRVKEQASGA